MLHVEHCHPLRLYFAKTLATSVEEGGAAGWLDAEVLVG